MRLSSDSPAPTLSLSRPPSIHSPSSPLLYTQRPALSPVGYYHSPPSSSASQYDLPFQPTVSPTLRLPRHNNHTEPTPSSSMHHTSLSRISTTSSFPQALLNPVSPQQSPLGGLEALVQAATAERDRLEAKASLDRKADTSRSTVRRSPELLFRPSHEASRTHLQAPAPRTPITPSLISGPLLRDSYSESSLRMGPEAHPSKRQRQSDPHSGSDHSWDSPPSKDPSSQFSGLIGPGIKPRKQSSEVRTEARLTLPIPLRDKEEPTPAASRVSPTRERPTARRQHVTEERPFRSHIPSYCEPITSVFAPDNNRRVLAAEEPRSMVHQDIQSNVDCPPPPKILHSDLLLDKQSTPPSPPPHRVVSTPSEPPAPPTPGPRQRSSLGGREDGCSPRARSSSSSHCDILAPTATAAQKVVETESATGSEKSMDSSALGASTMQDLVPLEPLPPDNLATAAPDSSVILASPSTLNANDDHLGSAEPVQPPSPTLPSPDPHNADIAITTQGIQSPPGISRLSLHPREDALNSPTSEQEARPPPTAASPTPRVLSPAASGLQNEISADQPVGVQVTAVLRTGTITPVAELQDPVDAQTSLTSPGELEAVNSPIAAPTAAVPPPITDDPPRTDHAPVPIVDGIRSEAASEQDVAMDSKRSQVTEQNHADMDVDEELLSLIADDLPSRSPQTISRKQNRFSSEDKRPPSHHAPPIQESALGSLTPSHPSPAPTFFAVNLERASMLSPDTAVAARDSEMSTLRPEERPTQKKKTKQHAQPKTRVKPSGSAKTKLKVSSDGPSTAPSKSKKSSSTVTKKSIISARSRSTSAMPVSMTPAPSVENRTTGEAELDDAEEEMEDKLYCVCKTRYDDERVMIACDRCDEWYHTSCVNMPDLEIDLVDQFICPLCVEKNPHLNLRTTWKRRCLNGLKQHDPNSPEACHRPARGAFSKYCSDECGVQYMHMRISLWVENGGNRDRLWETVKNAERREGVVVLARAVEGQSRSPLTMGDQAVLAIIPPKISKADRELSRLRARLETLVQKREALKAEMDVIAWREKVTELAIQHADTIEQCGWDQRLCFGEEEVADFGAGVLESYEENHAQTDVDGTQEEAEWWCMGKKKCDRHSGWQKLRVADVEFDKETKDQALQKLTKLEREIRKRVEDILDPHAHLDKAKLLEPSSPRVSVLSRSAVNGQAKHRPNGDQTKKGKKRKE
ncbi:hypothetical protein BJV74DRAFT_797182 [Russula compacta]|nr:hypothetical protein BJV74DRAFT_797182 [Russula compacta]